MKIKNVMAQFHICQQHTHRILKVLNQYFERRLKEFTIATVHSS